MALSDLFTPSVAFTLAICFLLAGLFGVYFTQKISQCTHKISTMFELIQTLANEVNMLRAFVSANKLDLVGGSSSTNSSLDIKLIHVSDCEDDDEEDDDEDEDEEDDDEDEDEEDDDEEDEDEEDDDLDEDDEVLEKLQINKNDESNIKEFQFEELNIEEDHDDAIESEVKNVEVVMDYKKATLNKLRSIAVEKGLVQDASKFKKPELLKLLESFI